MDRLGRQSEYSVLELSNCKVISIESLVVRVDWNRCGFVQIDVACCRRIHPAYDTRNPSPSPSIRSFAVLEHRRVLICGRASSRLVLAQSGGTVVLELLVESVTVTDGGDVVTFAKISLELLE
jgi:hypothetical protein